MRAFVIASGITVGVLGALAWSRSTEPTIKAGGQVYAPGNAVSLLPLPPMPMTPEEAAQRSALSTSLANARHVVVSDIQFIGNATLRGKLTTIDGAGLADMPTVDVRRNAAYPYGGL